MRISGSRGVTLLEVVICLVILAVAIPAFLTAIVQNVQLEAMNAEGNIALAAAQRVIEDVRAMNYDQINASSVPATFEASGLGNDGKTIRLFTSAGSPNVGQTSYSTVPNRKIVYAVVQWRSVTGEDRELRLMTETTSY